MIELIKHSVIITIRLSLVLSSGLDLVINYFSSLDSLG